jgi:hypothetical protein
MTLLLDRRSNQITITGKMLVAAAGNERMGEEVMALLLDRLVDQIIIIEKGGSGSSRNGQKLITLLGQRTRPFIPREIIGAATASGQIKVFEKPFDHEISRSSFSIARLYDRATSGDEDSVQNLLANSGIPADNKRL